MPDEQRRSGKVEALKAGCLEADGIAHGFFLRTGGVSEGFYASLNCGRGSGDERRRVEENRARVAAALGVPSARLIGPHQIHSDKVAVALKPWDYQDAPQADAVVTNVPGLAVSVLTADCVPILMADAAAGVAAAVHAGWKGAKAGIAERAIEAMERLGARAANITAAIGPAISQAAYEVGPEFKAALIEDCRDNERYFSKGRPGHVHFNLPGYVRDKLANAGLSCIAEMSVCTYQNESNLFSYRRSCHRSEADYGRQISAILLRDVDN